MGHEFEVMTRLWRAGVSVPYPIGYDGNVFDLEYVGDDEQAAPQLQAARLGQAELDVAFEQLIAGLHTIVAEGYAHADLSAYNLLWWDARLWFIDFPQAVDIAANPQGVEFLHRDVLNVCRWFVQRGLAIDPEEVFAEVLMSI
jgi:RIO kinase 1